eukprot:768612-Hanusia_phi.AAC.2
MAAALSRGVGQRLYNSESNSNLRRAAGPPTRRLEAKTNSARYGIQPQRRMPSGFRAGPGPGTTGPRNSGPSVGESQH